MTPGKVIVHGISTNLGDSTSPEDSTKLIKIELERVLEKYGPVICLYFESDETSQQPDSSAAKKSKMNQVGGGQNQVAHVLFENAEDAAKACQAAANNQVTLSDNVLILTLVPESSLTIEDLDDNSLLKIFSMLNPKDKLAIEEVCSRWKKLMKYSWPHTTTLLLQKFECSPSISRKYLSRCGEYLKLLNCSDVSSRTLLELILKYCKQLETLELDIYLDNCESVAFCEMFTGLQKLKSLKLHHQEKCFDMRFMECLPGSMENIHLSCGSGSNGTVYFDLSKFSNLQSLYLSGYDVFAAHLVRAEHLRHLIHLEFDDCRIYRQITRKFQHLITLKTLKIPRSGITDDILIEILGNNPGIESLDISQSPGVSDRSVQLASTLTNLKVLNVSMLPVTFKFMDEMPSLQRLECQECDKLTNEEVVRLIQLAPKLQHLNLCDSSITSALFPLVNAALERRDNDIQLEILTTESSSDWKNLVHPSPLLKIERTEGMKSDRLFLEQFGWHEDSDDMNDDRSYVSSSENSDY